MPPLRAHCRTARSSAALRRHNSESACRPRAGSVRGGGKGRAMSGQGGGRREWGIDGRRAAAEEAGTRAGARGACEGRVRDVRGSCQGYARDVGTLRRYGRTRRDPERPRPRGLPMAAAAAAAAAAESRGIHAGSGGPEPGAGPRSRLYSRLAGSHAAAVKRDRARVGRPLASSRRRMRGRVSSRVDHAAASPPEERPSPSLRNTRPPRGAHPGPGPSLSPAGP